MPVKLECPHCRISLAVPTKMLGTTASCPQCAGSFQVPAAMPEGSMAESSGDLGQVAPLPPPVAPDGAAAMPGPQPSPAAHPPSSLPTNGAAPPSRRVARFITPEKARSRLTIAGDGRLPELTLQETAGRPKSEKTAATSNPLVMMAVFGASAIASLLLLTIDTNPRATDARRSREARQLIREEYFHEAGERQFAVYEICLRRAQQAHSRAAYDDERRWYRKVIELLHAEGKNRYVGLTGSPNQDRRLEELIAEVLQSEP